MRTFKTDPILATPRVTRSTVPFVDMRAAYTYGSSKIDLRPDVPWGC